MRIKWIAGGSILRQPLKQFERNLRFLLFANRKFLRNGGRQPVLSCGPSLLKPAALGSQ